MHFWKLCLISAVLALSAHAQGDEEDNTSVVEEDKPEVVNLEGDQPEDGETKDNADGENDEEIDEDK